MLEAFADGGQVSAQGVTLEDGRQVQISLDRIDDGLGGGGNMGTLLTLRDMESVAQLGQELEVARRLAAIGKLTAGVGHEVKNPINAMVVHLELLRGKLAGGGTEAFGGAQRHVDILAGEMQRLDRVVQTLADFSRPMELHLREHDLRQVVGVGDGADGGGDGGERGAGDGGGSAGADDGAGGCGADAAGGAEPAAEWNAGDAGRVERCG